MIHKLISWFNVKIGYRYWYEVTIKYNVKDRNVFSYVTQIGLANKNTILNKRACKETILPFHLNNKIDNRVLNNGDVDLEVKAYLGYLKIRR